MTPARRVYNRIGESVRASGPLWTASLALDRILPVGVLRLWPETRVSAETLERQVESILRAWDMTPAHAMLTAERMLYADLHGIDSHGCAMLAHYHRALTDGALHAGAAVEVVRDSGATALVDGGGGLGHVPADTAMRLAIEKSGEAGVGVVGVRNSGHFGAAGVYASLAAEAGRIGVVTTNTQKPTVVPTFGREAVLGTNAMAVAAPASHNQPFLLDMATSTVSRGTIVSAWRRGRATIPSGWALGSRGRSMRSAGRAARRRRLTPLGGYKGYGLAAAVELLSSTLTGGHGDGSVGHLCVAIDPRRLREAGQFELDLDTVVDGLRASPPLDPRHPVLVAGDPERAAYEERRWSGIPLTRPVVEDIRRVARASGAPFVLDA